MARSPRVLAVGWFGEGNLGDEAMLDGVVGLLRRTFDAPAITVLTGDPDDARRRLGVEALPRPKPEAPGFRNLALVRASQAASLVTLGGGDLIREQADGVVPAQNWLARVRVALRLGKPVALIGASVGELWTPSVVKAVGDDLRRFAVLAVRDTESAERLRELTGREVHVMGDLALEALAALDPTAASVPPDQPGVARPPRIGVATRMVQGRGRSVGEDAGERLNRALAAALDRVVAETGARVVLVPFRTGRAKRDDDAVAGEALAAAATTGGGWERATPPATVGDFAALARGLDLVVGIRLHATILGAGAGVPVLGVAYDPKVSGFLADLGVPGQCLPLDADATSIADAITRSLGDPALRGRIATGIAGMRARTAALEPVLRAAAR